MLIFEFFSRFFLDLIFKRRGLSSLSTNFQFSRRTNWPWREEILSALQRGQKIIVNQRKPILVSIKPFTCQSLKRNEIERAVFIESGVQTRKDTFLICLPEICACNYIRQQAEGIPRMIKRWVCVRSHCF